MLRHVFIVVVVFVGGGGGGVGFARGFFRLNSTNHQITKNEKSNIQYRHGLALGIEILFQYI